MRQNASSIHPIWSWFGAGKTHTLHYISNRATQIRKQGVGHLRTVYSEFPQNPSSFIDVYRSFALQLDKDTLSEAYLEICTSAKSTHLEEELLNVAPDLSSALRSLVFGQSVDQDLAMRWLHAEALPIADCRKLGVSKKITSSEDSRQILVGIVRLFDLSAKSQSQINSRLVLVAR